MNDITEICQITSCHSIIFSSCGFSITDELSKHFSTTSDFWTKKTTINWEGSVEPIIKSRGETPQFKNISSNKIPSDALILDLPDHTTEQGPLGAPSWSGIISVLSKLHNLNKKPN